MLFFFAAGALHHYVGVMTQNIASPLGFQNEVGLMMKTNQNIGKLIYWCYDAKYCVATGVSKMGQYLSSLTNGNFSISVTSMLGKSKSSTILPLMR